jgi:hypothetical protein
VCLLDQAVQQVLLQRLAGHRSATPERGMNVVRYVLDLDTRHTARVAPFWRQDIYPGATDGDGGSRGDPPSVYGNAAWSPSRWPYAARRKCRSRAGAGIAGEAALGNEYPHIP